MLSCKVRHDMQWDMEGSEEKKEEYSIEGSSCF
jgi:hypothetical protein